MDTNELIDQASSIQAQIQAELSEMEKNADEDGEFKDDAEQSRYDDLDRIDDKARALIDALEEYKDDHE